MTCLPSSPVSGARRRQRGAALILVMLILVVVAGLGVAASNVAIMGERSARNDRDMQVAWQAAEAALMDAEFDIRGPRPSLRRATFGTGGASPDRTAIPTTGCGNADSARGLCAQVGETSAAKPAWLTVDFTLEGDNAPTTPFGLFTDQTYPSGATGVQSVKPPRFIIEPIRDNWDVRDKSVQADARYLYRVTAMGFGPRADIQAVAQMLLRP